MIRIVAVGTLLLGGFERVVGAVIAPPPVEWHRSYGGGGQDLAWRIRPTRDGGLMVVGTTDSWRSGNMTVGTHGNTDYWLLRLDAAGNRRWEQTLGGEGGELCVDILEQTDGSFLVCGQSSSTTNGTRILERKGLADIWMVKVDANGIKLWEKSYGGPGWVLPGNRVAREGNQMVFACLTESGEGIDKSEPSFGLGDVWVLAVDLEGNKLWDRTFGGEGEETESIMVDAAPGGGWIIANCSNSLPSGNKTSPNHGDKDFWILRLDHKGEVLWEKAYGGEQYEAPSDILTVRRGGSIVMGRTNSDRSGNKETPHYGSPFDYDVWVIRLDEQGGKLWERNYGGSASESGGSLTETPEGGFLMMTTSNSEAGTGNKTSPRIGSDHYWLIRLDHNGNELWQQSIGEPSRSIDGFPVLATQDGGYLVAGRSYNSVFGLENYGSSDLLLTKLRPDVITLRAWPTASAKFVGTGFQFQLSAPTNRYVLEWKEPSADWMPFATNDLSSNAVMVIDGTADRSAQRIYRARVANE